MSAMNEISLYHNDNNNNNSNNNSNGARLKVGGGARLGTVAATLYDRWNRNDDSMRYYYLPMGHCSTVGVTGLTLAGGHGIATRLFGLTSQRVTALEMIDAKGRLLKISPTSHADL
jgi:FAD/FMN-containing dehydrogenase